MSLDSVCWAPSLENKTLQLLAGSKKTAIDLLFIHRFVGTHVTANDNEKAADARPRGRRWLLTAEIIAAYAQILGK